MAYVPYNQYDIPQDEWNRIKEEWQKLEFQYQGKERGGLPLHPNDIVIPEELKPLFKQFSYARQGYEIPDYGIPFYIENTDTVSGSISFQNMSGKNIEYSFDEVNWTTLPIPSNTAVTISSVAPGSKVYLRGTNSAVGNSTSGNHISADFNHNIGGNICSLLDKTNFSTMTSITSDNAFSNLFYQTAKLIYALFNLGNVVSLGNYSFYQVFYKCSSLTTSPDLSNITSVGNNTFYNAFRECTSLITGPDLSNVTSLGSYALFHAFQNCTSLITGPDLSNVASIGSKALDTMFSKCSKLQTVYVPNVSTWDTSKCNSWVSLAGGSAATPKQMIFQTQSLLDACPSGDSGYGTYTKILAA